VPWGGPARLPNPAQQAYTDCVWTTTRPQRLLFVYLLVTVAGVLPAYAIGVDFLPRIELVWLSWLFWPLSLFGLLLLVRGYLGSRRALNVLIGLSAAAVALLLWSSLFHNAIGDLRLLLSASLSMAGGTIVLWLLRDELTHSPSEGVGERVSLGNPVPVDTTR
jgi:hypothetical protein